MPTRYAFDDVFDMISPSKTEVETPRTPDFSSLSKGPNWGSRIKIFSLGLHNASESTLSNMVASKTKDSLSLYDFLDIMQSQQMMFMEFLTNIISQLLDKITGEVNE